MSNIRMLFASVFVLALIAGGCQKQDAIVADTAPFGESFAKASAQPGAVYTLSNAVAGNSVIVFRRGADGSLTETESYSTGGTGTGGGLGSQGAVILDKSNRFLFAVNAGSDEISVFSVTPGGLQWKDKVSSGGIRPISLTVNKNILYVLNGGGDGNITGFEISASGTLTSINGSINPLSGNAVGPAQVEFSPNGKHLVVTEKATNMIDVFTVGAKRVAGARQSFPSAGQTPFGFAFAKNGALIVSEAFGGAPLASVLSSYHLSDQGILTTITANAATHQTAACWVVITNNGKYAYETNTGSGSISGYSISQDGSISLLTPDGRTGVTGDNTSPIDASLSINSQYLYTLNARARTISIFSVNADGSLTSQNSVGSLPMGVVGLAAR